MAHYNGCQGNAAAAFSVGAEADPELNLNADAFPEDAIGRQITTSPSEFDKYLVGDVEVNWCPVKFELSLEDQTDSLTIQEHHRLEFQQAGPSTSSVYSSMIVAVEGEASGGASFTDMTSTMRVAREATNALYSVSDSHPANHPSELTQYLSHTAMNPSEAQAQPKSSPPTTLQSSMNTPSPSSNSDGSHCAYISPHYSPQHQPQGCCYNTYNQGQNPVASTSEQSPPPYSHQFLNHSTPTYHHVPSQMAPTYSHIYGQTMPTYNYQNQITPTYSHSHDNPPAIPHHLTSHTFPVPTPLSTSTNNPSYPDDSKVRNGKMYTTYLNNHDAVVPKYERPSRHPSDPSPSPLGHGSHGRVQPTNQPENSTYPLPPDVPFSHFFPGLESIIVPYQLPSAPQASLAPPRFGYFSYPTNYGAQSCNQSQQIASQFPAPHSSKGLGGARRRASFKNNNKGESSQGPSKKSPKASSSRDKERTARRAASKLSRGVIKRKRGCTCYRCQIVFASSGHLKRHLEAHGSNRRFKCNHPFCDVAYSRQDNLKTHVAKATHRRDGDPYVIPVSDVEDSDTEEYDFTDDSGIVVNGDFEPSDE